jgi:glycosyltransferase involved in cell wall biosynthesis
MLPEAKLKIAVLADFREEEWTSMDLAADMLLTEAAADSRVSVTRVQPAMARRASLLLGGRIDLRQAHNLDRAEARYLQYPAHARKLRADFDAFHIVDHSYAHLALFLPPERTGIYCHDVDAFRSALEVKPYADSWRRALSLVLAAGLRRAGSVFYSTNAVRSEIEHFELVRPERLVQAPLGVASEFTSGEGPSPREPRLLLHVGSVVPRKNASFLLRLTAELRLLLPDLKLLQVGGKWQPEHLELIGQLGLESAVEQVRNIPRAELASHYRRASVVLMPSRAEGFGIPVAEALACGAIVVASDLDVLREVGGDAVIYCPVDALSDWRQRVFEVLTSDAAPARELRLQRAGRYSWRRHAEIIIDRYSSRSTKVMTKTAATGANDPCAE